MILETERLYLREMNQSDFDSLCSILQDEDTMYAYEGAFSDDEVQEWLDKQIFRYQKWNFGLWAVILKETNEMIGQCGLTMQPWKDKEVLEIGYLLARPYWHKGYAIEAAKACKTYAFEILKANITEVWICLITVMWYHDDISQNCGRQAGKISMKEQTVILNKLD